MKKVLLLASLLFAVAASGFTDASSEYPLGSADNPEGTTLIVSVFVSDNTYDWNFGLQEDVEACDNILKYMGVAVDYLTDEFSKYGKESTFIYDFEENEDLYYADSFDGELTQDDSETAESYMIDFLDECVNSDALCRKYDADNIIYFMFVNTDEDNTSVSCTKSYYEGMEDPYEIVFLYNVDQGEVNCPAVYAHEIMHTFGVPDLYMPDEEYGINKPILDYIQSNMPNDLMFICNDIDTGDYVYDRVTNDLSDLDAYYAGLTDQCSLVDEFNLNPSQHIANDEQTGNEQSPVESDQ